MRNGGKRRAMSVLALVGFLLLVAASIGLRRSDPEDSRKQGPPVAPGSGAEDSPARAGPEAAPAPPEAAPSGTIAFRVMDRNERTPIGSARVEIEGEGLRLSASTGAGGLARFADLPAGALLLARISPPDREPRLRVEYESACVPAGSEEVVEVYLHTAEARNGVVLDTLTGGPIAGARVESRGAPWPEGDVTGPEALGPVRSEAVTGPDGSFVLGDTSRCLVVRAAGYATVWKSRRVKLGPDREVIHLAPAGAIEGIVTDRTGAPVAGARVRFYPELESGPVRDQDLWDDVGWRFPPREWQDLTAVSVVTTGANGRFRIDTVAPDDTVSLLADAPGKGVSSIASGVRVPADGPATVELVLDAAAVLDLRVRRGDGVPPGRFTIIVWTRGARLYHGPGEPAGGGRCLVCGLPGGPTNLDIQVLVPGCEGASIEAVLRAGETTVVETEVRSEAEAAKERWRETRPEPAEPAWPECEIPIVLPAGAPEPPWVRVEYAHPGGSGGTGGSFEYHVREGILRARIPEDADRVVLRVLGYRPAEIPLPIRGGKTGPVHLECGIVAEIVVLTPDGQPAAGAEVSLADPRIGLGRTDDGGRFVVPGYGDGDAKTFLVECEPWAPAEVTVTFRESMDPVVVRFSPWGRLVVLLLDEDGVPIARAAVRLLGPWHFRWEPADFAGLTDHAGRLNANVHPGEYRLEILVPGQTIEDGKPWQTEVEIPPGPGELLTLRVPRRP